MRTIYSEEYILSFGGAHSYTYVIADIVAYVSADSNTICDSDRAAYIVPNRYSISFGGPYSCTYVIADIVAYVSADVYTPTMQPTALPSVIPIGLERFYVILPDPEMFYSSDHSAYIVCKMDILLISSVLVTCIHTSFAFNVKGWQSLGDDVMTMPWPESKYINVDSGQSIALSLSGGGDRSYTASIGYLGALHELNMIEDISYVTGVSGGAWATSVYSYYQFDEVTDDIMLGNIIFPANITFDGLNEMDSNCVRAFVNSTYRLGGPTYEDWADAVQV